MLTNCRLPLVEFLSKIRVRMDSIASRITSCLKVVKSDVKSWTPKWTFSRVVCSGHLPVCFRCLTSAESSLMRRTTSTDLLTMSEELIVFENLPASCSSSVSRKMAQCMSSTSSLSDHRMRCSHLQGASIALSRPPAMKRAAGVSLCVLMDM